ncbi:hypothetical protein G647_09697 [Cladophialophora carrionii CBS 160.54]|uniref:Clr5 domain-containing protein n=1 Tax=Cladophialophora carrionii CBS 160.54 TaxID=1279043 RepID=V9DLH8_9EURO|nr:uncharacterized protein G647_09697 [Cladophialophora carrionii CBS 160.54]ETI27506.1 hypothetical protein G647_09697 [Cladophialophora carrionii CBS 160.54]
MAADRSPQPPKAAWERRKHIIRRWYLTENRTCEDIQRTLEADGFKVSERQIKNRLSEWKFERKKTPFQQYVAMLVVADYYKSRGVEIDFEVPKREERVTYTAQKVRKECERVKKRYATRGQPLALPSLSHAQVLLEENKISWCEKHLMVRPNIVGQDHRYNGLLSPLSVRPQESPAASFSLVAENEPVPVRDSRFPGSPNILDQESYSPVSSLPSCSSCSKWQIHLESMSYENSAPMCIPEKTDTPMTIHTPETMYSHTSTFPLRLRRSHPVVPVFQFDPSTMTSNFSPDFTHTASVQWPSLTPSPHAPVLRTLPALRNQSPVASLADFDEEAPESSTAVVKWSRSEFTICRRCSPPHSHRDFDFNESIDSLENKFPLVRTNYLDMLAFSGNTKFDDHLSAELHKLTASQWAAPYYMQCSFKDVRRDALERSKAHSMNALQYALEHNNEFILPALSWVILVLGQTERKQLLAHFLRDSCALIDKQPRVRRSFTYATPFRYAWAWARDDEEDMNRIGDDLERSHMQIGQIWGIEHPNYFVSGYLFAWHLIRKGEYDKAIQMLTDSLPVCERRMGRHDLLTVSCLAVVSRAHSEIGNLPLAVEYCQRAMAATELLVADQNRSKVHRPVLQSFSLELLERRASLTLHLRDHLSAEKQMWRVFHLRGHLDGLHSGGTWSAAQKLGPMLEQRGYSAAWEELMAFIRGGYRWEQLNAWYKEDARTRQPPPPPPTAPPCWWPFRRKDGQMGCPACPEAEQFYNFSTRRILSPHHLDPCFGMVLDTEC